MELLALFDNLSSRRNLYRPDMQSLFQRGSLLAVEIKEKRRTRLKIGTWNVRTLMDSARSGRPQRRTALVGRDLGRYWIEIATLSEARFAEVGEIKGGDPGYTFFWSGRKSEERREAGVDFANRSDLVGKLSEFPNCISDRLMTMGLHLSIISISLYVRSTLVS